MLVEWGVVALLATVSVCLLVATGASQRLDNIIYDALIRATPRPAGGDVMIVAIDDRALAELGRWPWSRRTHAALIDRLTEAGVGAVGYDVLFIEPAADPADDEALASAIARSGRVCLPVLIEAPGRDGAAFELTPPVGRLAGAAAGLGHVTLNDDPDGVSRRADLSQRAGARSIPHLMDCERWVGRGASIGSTQGPLPKGAEGAPLLRRDVVMIPYAGAPGRIPTISAASIIRGETPAGFLRGKQVIVGATAAGLHDRHATPVSTRNDTMTGAELQATLLEGLIADRLNRPAATGLTLAFGLAVVWAVLFGLAALPPRWNLALVAAVLTASLGLSAALLYLAGLWLPPSPGVLTLLVLFPVWGWRRLEAASAYMTGELQRLSEETGVPPQAGQGGDPVTRQIALMARATQRARELRAVAAAAAAHRDRVIQFLSHDMRSPQSSILAVLETAPAGAVPPQVSERIAGYARRTLDLADNFAHLARAEGGALDPQLLDLCDLTAEAIDDLWPIANRSGATLSGVGLDAEVLVRGDSSLLARAIGNLIGNALKYGPADGVVTCTVGAANGVATLSVIDQGPGLSVADPATLFERFSRAPRDLTPGIGLGLTLVAEVARRHGGAAEARNQPGGGAVFTLTLPLASGA